MAYTIKVTRATAARWLELDPVLAAGEPGFEKDTNKLKIGDGTTAWSLLAYVAGGSSGGGTIWLEGSGVPDNGTGTEGSYYINTLNGDVYIKGPSVWSFLLNIKGADGADGSDGVDGINWYSGTVDPTTQGIDGELYLNTTSCDVFKKISGTWALQVNIKGVTGDPGTDGTNGATWLSGTGAPSSGLGADNDFYLDTTTKNVYKKTSGAWAVICNLLVTAQTARASLGSSNFDVGTSTWTTIDWVNEVIDDVGAIDITNYPKRITVPAGYTRICLKAYVPFVNSTSAYRFAQVRKNGTGNPIVMTASGGAYETGLILDTGWISCSEGDYYEVLADSTGGQDVLGSGTWGGPAWFQAEFA